MSKKLLEESTIRSFMKLANLQPLTDKFLKESDDHDDDDSDEEDEEEDEEEEDEEESLQQEDMQLEEEVVEEEGDMTAEGKESEGRPSTPRPKIKGVAKPGKMHAAKNAAGDAKLKPMKQTSHHSVSGNVKVSDETGSHSNAKDRMKKHGQFDIVAESLEEEMEDEAAEGPEMDAPEGGEEMGSAGETGDHKEKMKGLIRDMLGKLSEMGSEYGLNMEVSDEGGGEGGEEGPPEAEISPEGAEEDESMKQEQLDEMVNRLTKRVAARLVKESKKKR